MKYLRQFLSLLFALVMCVGIFSGTVNAESLPNHTYTVSSVSSVITGDRMQSSVISYPDNGEIERATKNDWIDFSTNLNLSDVRLESSFIVANDNGSSLFVGGRETVARFQNLYASFLFGSGDNVKYFYHNSSSTINIMVHYVDGSLDVINDCSFIHKGSGLYDITFTFTPTKDVKKIEYNLITFYKVSDIDDYAIVMPEMVLCEVTINTGEYEDGNNFLLVEQETQDTTLLKGILQKITSGFQNVVDKLTSGFESIVNGIVELPAKIWEFIENGLKDLFVPSEEVMTAYKDKWDELLASRFGAVYQVVNIITDSWDGIIQADETNTINFPQATINFSGTPFTFGGYDVKIVPDGFSVLVTAIKTIVAIVCTVAFVNGMRKRYDEIMGVEQ